jgi:hypothetical protein
MEHVARALVVSKGPAAAVVVELRSQGQTVRERDSMQPRQLSGCRARGPLPRLAPHQPISHVDVTSSHQRHQALAFRMVWERVQPHAPGPWHGVAFTNPLDCFRRRPLRRHGVPTIHRLIQQAESHAETGTEIRTPDPALNQSIANGDAPDEQREWQRHAEHAPHGGER